MHRQLIKFSLNDAFRFEVTIREERERNANREIDDAMRMAAKREEIQDKVAVRLKTDASGDIVVTSSPDNKSRIYDYINTEIYIYTI